jgi:hypothetical protein
MWGPQLHECSYEVHTHTAKRKRGRIRMLKIPSPLPFHPHCYVWHLGDAAEVNAQRVERDRDQRAARAARMKKLHKKHEKKKDDDGWWYSLCYAALYLGRRENARRWRARLQRWKDKVCRLLGRPIDTRPFENGCDNLVDYFSKRDLDDIRKALKELKSLKAKTTSRADAVELIGASEKTVNKLLAKAAQGELFAKAAQGAKRTHVGVGSDERLVGLTEINNDAIEVIVEYRRQPTIPEAATILGVDRSVVDDLIARELLSVLPDPFGYQRYKRLDRTKVEDLKVKRDAPDISIDDEGTWLPGVLATQTYPNATPKILHKYANKPCPQLNGDILHAQTFPADPLAPKRKRKRNGYRKWLEADLKRLQPGKVGKPGQKAAMAARAKTPANGKDSPAQGAPARLTASAARALNHIRQNPGTPGKTIAKAIGVTPIHFRKTLVPILKAHGVFNDGNGYYEKKM